MTTEDEIRIQVLKKMILEALADDFAVSTEKIIRNLAEFTSGRKVSLIDSLRSVYGDIEIVNDEQLSKFVDIIHSEKTVGSAAAKAAIIVVSSFIKLAAQTSGFSRDKLFSVPPVVLGGKSWVQSIEVASNYIRHLDEWQIPSKEYVKRGDHLIIKKIKNLIGKLQRRPARRNADFLRGLGFKPEQLVGVGTDISYQIAVKLGLDDFDQTTKRFEQWCSQIS